MPQGSTRRLCGALAAGLALGAAPAAAQQSDADWLAECRESRGYVGDEAGVVFCEVRVERVRPRGRLAVDGARNGGVAVQGGAGAEAVVHARITTRARDAAAAAALARQLRIVARDDTVYAAGPDEARGRRWYVSYLVEVPRRLDLAVTTHNGGVSVRDVSGRLDLSTHNGGMSLSDLGGDVHARTHNGSLRVALGGTRWDGGGLDAATRNGSVRLEIPDGYAARLETGTENGRFRTAIPITVQGRLDRRLSTDLNGGGPPVRATTRNGSVEIGRRGEP
jgi:hypothetical protein